MSNYFIDICNNNILINNLVSPASLITGNNNNLDNSFYANGNSLQFLKPQGNLDIFKSSWQSNLTSYTINNNDIFNNFAPYTSVFSSSGTYTHTLKNLTTRWAALLVAGGGGGMGGTQYNGGNNGAGGGGGSSGQWLFAYSNLPITNRTLNITIGSGGKGSIGVDSTSGYQYPLTQPTAGESSLITINGTTILLANGGNTGQGFTSGNVGSIGGVANSTSIVADNSMVIYMYNNGTNGSNGSNSSSQHPPGGVGGINSFSSIQINNFFRYINENNTELDIVLSSYGAGGNGGYGEGTGSGYGGRQNGFDASGGLAIVFEYQFPSTFNTTLATSKLLTNTNTLTTLTNNLIMPYGYNYLNFYIYGAGGSGATPNGTAGSAGAGSGGYIQAINIPYSFGNIYITSITYIISSESANSNTIVTINYSSNYYIQLVAGSGGDALNTGTQGANGGIVSYTNTTTFYQNSNIFGINGAKGGNQGVTGTNNGYISSGSGVNNNSTAPVSNSSSVTKIIYSNDGKQYTFTSNGGGSNQIVYGYGSGGAATPSGYQSNATAYRNGIQGAILYTLSI